MSAVAGEDVGIGTGVGVDVGTGGTGMGIGVEVGTVGTGMGVGVEVGTVGTGMGVGVDVGTGGSVGIAPMIVRGFDSLGASTSEGELGITVGKATLAKATPVGSTSDVGLSYKVVTGASVEVGACTVQASPMRPKPNNRIARYNLIMS